MLLSADRVNQNRVNMVDALELAFGQTAEFFVLNWIRMQEPREIAVRALNLFDRRGGGEAEFVVVRHSGSRVLYRY